VKKRRERERERDRERERERRRREKGVKRERRETYFSIKIMVGCLQCFPMHWETLLKPNGLS
jgi:hypothetical protein